jgi:hypothetical protein
LLDPTGVRSEVHIEAPFVPVPISFTPPPLVPPAQPPPAAAPGVVFRGGGAAGAEGADGGAAATAPGAMFTAGVPAPAAALARPMAQGALASGGGAPASGPAAPASPAAPAAAPPRRPRPMARQVVDLQIDALELEYLDHVGGLLAGNLRALKRFVNTYRLVKSALSDVELQVFRSPIALFGGVGKNRPRYLPYRMCMAQLAVLCTQRERALEMVRLADETEPDEKLGPWLDLLASKVDDRLAACFREALTADMKDLDQVDFSTFKLWLERTRRYSFYL